MIQLKAAIPGARSPRHLPSLDGWRAIAIFAVVSLHDPEVHGFGLISTLRLHQFGWAGVDLFFAISGLLICSRLLDEERIHGRISLRAFYIRRVFRILPGAWVFLAVSLALGLLHQVPCSIPATIASLLMVRNYWAIYSGELPNEMYTDHFWSLSVEEHFYLLLPPVLVFARRRILVLSILLVAAYSSFLLFVRYGTVTGNLSYSRTDLRLHGLLFPALLAVILSRPGAREFATRWLRPWFWMAVAAVMCFPHKLDLGVKIGMVGLCFPFLVLSTVLHPESVTCRILEWKPLRFVGRLSYGMYLWQQILMLRPAGVRWPFSIVHQFPLNYAALMCCALASYYLVEKPFIAFGRRATATERNNKRGNVNDADSTPLPERSEAVSA